MQPLIVNGTELGAQEWRDSLFLRYEPETPDLTKLCDCCNAAFSICHALDCKQGGLVTVGHNELCDRVADLDGKAFTSTHVRDKPPIFAGRSVQRRKAQMAGTIPRYA